MTINSSSVPGFVLALILPLLAGSLRAAEPAVADSAVPPQIALDTGWMLRSAEGLAADGSVISRPGCATTDWLPTAVPGTVLNAYVANGRYPEPYYGLNNKLSRGLIPDASVPGSVFTFPHWYRTAFTLPTAYRGKTVWLELKGVNWKADIWVNGTRVGTMAGMFKRGLFDISRVAVPGANQVAIKVYPLDFPGDVKNPRDIGRNGATMIQTVGWDFTFPDGVRDRNMGIHRGVRVLATGPVLVRDPCVTTVDVPAESAELQLKTVVINATDREQAGTLLADFEGVRVSQHLTLAPGETREVVLTAKEHPELVVKKPRIWWPLGRGKQELYDLRTAFAEADGKLSHEIHTRFGIRHLRTDTSFNRQLTFRVNGQRLFITGGNWVQDAMLRNTAARYDAQLRYIAQAGVNLLRCWSGSGIEDDTFFDLCDRYGILVWVESGLAVQVCDPDDAALQLENWRDAVRRVRGHPSVAYYCGSNEGADIAGMRDVTMEADGTRGYQPNSQDFGERGNPYRYLGVSGVYDHTVSDIWGPGPQGPLAGFCNETGAPCLPSLDCLREQMPEQALWPPDWEVFRYQDGDGFYRMAAFIEEGCTQYGDFDVPDRAGRIGAENYAFKGQILGAMLYRALGEVWKRNKWDFAETKSGGYAFWTINSTQPQACSRIYSYSLEPNASLYYLGHANKPLHVQYDYWKNDVSVVNDVATSATGLEVRAEVRNLDGSVQWHDAKKALRVGPDANAIGVLTVPPKDVPGLDDVHFICIELRNADGKRLDSQVYWRSRSDPKYGTDGPFTALGTMPAARLQVKTSLAAHSQRRVVAVTLTNSTPHMAFFLRLRVCGKDSSRAIRPSLYEDNYFTILPGDARNLQIDLAQADLRGEAPLLVIEGWNVGTCTVGIPGEAVTPALPASVPDTFVNLALRRPVTVSSTHTTQSPGMAAATVDGDRATRWSSEFSDRQWIAVDLGARREVRRVVLRWDPAYAKSYAVQVADSADGPWTTVRKITDGDGGTDYIPGLSATGRWIRLLFAERGSPWGYSLWDFEVYGKN